MCVVYTCSLLLALQADESPPDVWLQLLECCATVSGGQPAPWWLSVIGDLGLQLLQQQRQVSTQQETITQLQQQNTQQQLQISTQEYIIQQLQQHASQLQHSAAGAVELRGRVVALEG